MKWLIVFMLYFNCFTWNDRNDFGIGIGKRFPCVIVQFIRSTNDLGIIFWPNGGYVVPPALVIGLDGVRWQEGVVRRPEVVLPDIQ